MWWTRGASAAAERCAFAGKSGPGCWPGAMLSCGSYAVNPLPTPRELMNGRKDQHDHGSTGRTEPTLGNLDNLDGPAPKSREDDGLPKFTLDPDMRRGGSP